MLCNITADDLLTQAPTIFVTFASNPNSKYVNIPSTNPNLTPNAKNLQFHIPLTLFFFSSMLCLSLPDCSGACVMQRYC